METKDRSLSVGSRVAIFSGVFSARPPVEVNILSSGQLDLASSVTTKTVPPDMYTLSIKVNPGACRSIFVGGRSCPEEDAPDATAAAFDFSFAANGSTSPARQLSDTAGEDHRPPMTAFHEP